MVPRPVNALGVEHFQNGVSGVAPFSWTVWQAPGWRYTQTPSNLRITMLTRLPLETQTLHAELLEHLLGVHARRSFGRLSGSFVEKEIKGETYVYFQSSQPGGSTRQFYVGRKTRPLERLVATFERDRAEVAPDLERVRRLSAQVRAGGAAMTDAPSARVIRALADAGMFAAGGVLVGTHAFVSLGNLLGIRWSVGSLRTQDVDLARASESDIDMAVPNTDLDVPKVLDSLKMGFVPVPPLDPKQPSTSFKVRGQALRVDLLCPHRRPGHEAQPVFLPRFNAAAQPLDFLDYLLEAPERGLIVNGGSVLVSVPAPARFALHKLLVAQLRPPAMQGKAEKDLGQASNVLEALMEDRPGDIELAWAALSKRGRRWEKAGRRGLDLLKRRESGLHARIVRLLHPTRAVADTKRRIGRTPVR